MSDSNGTASSEEKQLVKLMSSLSQSQADDILENGNSTIVTVVSLPHHSGADHDEGSSYSLASKLGEDNDSSGRSSRVHVASLQIPHLHIPHGQGTSQKSENGSSSATTSKRTSLSHVANNDSNDEEEDPQERVTVTESYQLKDEDSYLLTFSTADVGNEDDDPNHLINSESLCPSPGDNNSSELLPSNNEIITGDPDDEPIDAGDHCCSNCKTALPKDSTSLKSFHDFLPDQYYDTGTGNVVNVMIVDAIAEVFKIQWTCSNFSEISERADLFLCLDCASTLAQLYQLYNQFASLAVKSKSFLSAVINFQKDLQADVVEGVEVEDRDEGQGSKQEGGGCENSDTEHLVRLVTPISPQDILGTGIINTEHKVSTPTWKRKRPVKKVHRYGDDDENEEDEDDEGSSGDNRHHHPHHKDDNYEDSSVKIQKSDEFFQYLNSDEGSNISLDKAIPPKKRNKRRKYLQEVDIKIQKLGEDDKTANIKVEGMDSGEEPEDHDEEDMGFDPLIVSTTSGRGGEEEDEPLQAVLQRLRGPFNKKGRGSGKYLKCVECKKKFMFPIQLRIHLNSQSHRDRVKGVKKEDQDSIDESEERSLKVKIRKPIRKESSSSKPNKSKTLLSCDTCDTSFSNNKELRRHMKSHKDGLKSAGDCDRCGKNFKTLGGLKIHYAAHLRDDNKYSCKDCGKKFRKQEALELHEKTDHGGFKPHACPHCDKCFRLKDKLKLHIMVIHDKKKPFPCPKCEKSFRTKYHLKIHDVSQHIQGGDTSVGCSQCKRKFPDRETLEKHVLVHEQEKPFICSVCTKGFHTSARLKLHEKSHQEMPSCLCPICGRAYKHVRDLKLHEVVHQDESTYRFGCGDCPRRFYRIDLLRVHQSNEKHFSAEVVGPTVSKSQAGKDTSFFQIHEDTLEENEEDDDNETDSEQPAVVSPPKLSKKKRKPAVDPKAVRVLPSSHLQRSTPATSERDMTIMHPHTTVVYHPSTMLQLHVDQSSLIPPSSGGYIKCEGSSGGPSSPSTPGGVGGSGSALISAQNLPSSLSLTSHHQHRYVQNEGPSIPTTAYIINPSRDRQNISHHHHLHHQGATTIQIQPGGTISTSTLPAHSHIQIGSGNAIYTFRDAAGNPINVSNVGVGGTAEPIGFDIISSFFKELQ